MRLTPHQRDRFRQWCLDKATELKKQGVTEYPHKPLQREASEDLGFPVNYVTLNRQMTGHGIAPNGRAGRPRNAHPLEEKVAELEERITKLETASA